MSTNTVTAVLTMAATKLAEYRARFEQLAPAYDASKAAHVVNKGLRDAMASTQAAGITVSPDASKAVTALLEAVTPKLTPPTMGDLLDDVRAAQTFLRAELTEEEATGFGTLIAELNARKDLGAGAADFGDCSVYLTETGTDGKSRSVTSSRTGWAALASAAHKAGVSDKLVTQAGHAIAQKWADKAGRRSVKVRVDRYTFDIRPAGE